MVKEAKQDSGVVGFKMVAVDYTGNKFGKLLAIERLVIKKRTHYVCKCECGNTSTVRSDSLIGGNTKSCGCLPREVALATHTTHGDSYTRLYGIYRHIQGRCYNERNDRFHMYGGRGIRVCEEWRNDYNNFKEWALSNGYSDELSIDRIDNDGDYSPQNCRWACNLVQSNNTSRNRYVTHQDKTLTMAEWSRLIGVPYKFVSTRVYKGKSIAEILKDAEQYKRRR